jgi:hypothetical protein
MSSIPGRAREREVAAARVTSVGVAEDVQPVVDRLHDDVAGRARRISNIRGGQG